jgi:light-regulated signal transduction histidine kinase (bacteriophytochrome)
MGDKTLLSQLLQNLIGNAIKFRGEQKPKIHIGLVKLGEEEGKDDGNLNITSLPQTTYELSRNEPEWLFWVKDNGIGIEPQYRDRIFVIFQRLHTRDEYPGSGMGLAICKKIVECHRGQIWVDSDVGQGATFYFTLPVGGRDRTSGRRTQSYFLDRR